MSNFDNTNNEFDIDLLGFFDLINQTAKRKKFDTMLAQEIIKAKNTISYVSLLLVEIDYFKNYLDTYGHQARASCLQQVAFSLESSFKRAGDLVTRWGDSQFICLLTDTDFIGAEKMGERLRKAIMALNIPHVDSPVAKIVTVSIGSVSTILTDDTSCDELITKVEQALSHAIEMGRNQFINWEK
ncbi:MAG: GGDEF domain-containing protein [Acetobacterium sp.]|nr:GGDEF domain-containing protein [Bacillota bacterium]MCG2730667.1 GGDEF domain-containing protein [Acetobacterium sp.]